MSDTTSHSLVDDAQGLIFGTLMCALGLQFLTHSGLITGQTAGLALVISYATGWGFGAVFFVVNLPFYWFGYRRLGLRFTIKSLISVALLSAFAQILPHYLSFQTLHPLLAGILFGFVTGAGLLALFRHGSSLGGIGIVALMIQDRSGFRAGWTQMIFDLVLFTVALIWIAPDRVLWSLPGVVILNLVLAINHRRDRYIAI
ncbi:YitT family protein [Xinfangfangia sp. D13-10-4-6]|uniref:YitT family protein n=1 Tax=Pseudogemmobacter hezensis TaxID=2737662 RepID=UPI0015565AC1|nr:YitT family protein [Pseudogemmobacter hezensis]NPD16916.1 YitT family protein [Pseudogemmobacter hezensis]